MKYPLINRMGITVLSSFGFTDFIYAQDLERALEKAMVVYGHNKNGTPSWWGPHENNKYDDTHKALLICVEELPKEPLKVEFVDKFNCHEMSMPVPKQFKGKKFKTIFEEIRE